jgi:hypothetical protein
VGEGAAVVVVVGEGAAVVVGEGAAVVVGVVPLQTETAIKDCNIKSLLFLKFILIWQRMIIINKGYKPSMHHVPELTMVL